MTEDVNLYEQFKADVISSLQALIKNNVAEDAEALEKLKGVLYELENDTEEGKRLWALAMKVSPPGTSF